MERFYYTVLPREGLICGAVAYVEGCPAGFVVATHDHAGFMRAGLRRWWPHLAWVVGMSILVEPKRLGAVWEVCQLMRSRRPTGNATREGEILSIGVLSHYREPGFVRQSGFQISVDLLGSAVAQLGSRGNEVIRVIVDADNIQSRRFFQRLGWNLVRTSVPGWRVPSVEFVFRPRDQHGTQALAGRVGGDSC